MKQWISRKVIDVAKVYERMECEKLHKDETVHYIEDINIKKERKKERIYSSSSNRAREEDVSTDNFAVDFDFSYGEDEKEVNQSVRNSFFTSLASDFKTETEDIAAKIAAAFTPAYQKQVKPVQNRIKPVATFQKYKEDPEETELKAAKDSLQDTLSATEMIDFMRLGINKSKAWVKSFLFGTGQTLEPERIKKQIMQMRNEGIL
jgi:hypothetical protein